MPINLGQFLPGPALALGGSLLDRESGEELEARQYLRNLFTSPGYAPGAANYISSLYTDPSAISRGLTGQVGALQQYYDPLLQQQENELLNNAQQRIVAGLPGSVGQTAGIGGPEIFAIREAIQKQLYPTRLAHLADQARENLSLQTNAAGRMFGAGQDAATKLLELSRPNPFASALAQLGTLLAYSSMQGGGGGAAAGTGSVGGGGIIDQLLASVFGGGGAAAGGGAAGGGAGLSSLAAPAAIAATAAAIGKGSYELGKKNENADWLKFMPAVGPGAWLGQKAQQRENKALFLQEDLDSQRDQVNEIGNIGGQFLQQYGATPQQVSEWSNYVSQLAATSESPADEQGAVAQRLGQMLLPMVQARGYATLDQVPGLRSAFIDYLMKNTFTAGNSSVSGGAPAEAISQWSGLAGLARGGMLPEGGMAMVGERGPELMLAGPGTMVMPLHAMWN